MTEEPPPPRARARRVAVIVAAVVLTGGVIAVQLGSLQLLARRSATVFGARPPAAATDDGAVGDDSRAQPAAPAAAAPPCLAAAPPPPGAAVSTDCRLGNFDGRAPDELVYTYGIARDGSHPFGHMYAAFRLAGDAGIAIQLHGDGPPLILGVGDPDRDGVDEVLVMPSAGGSNAGAEWLKIVDGRPVEVRTSDGVAAFDVASPESTRRFRCFTDPLRRPLMALEAVSRDDREWRWSQTLYAWSGSTLRPVGSVTGSSSGPDKPAPPADGVEFPCLR